MTAARKTYQKEYQRKYRAANKERVQGWQRAWRDENRERDRKNQREATARWRAANPEKAWLRQRNKQLQKYGLTKDGLDRLLATQGGGCAVCGSDSPGLKGRDWSVDHCHATGVVRGILCWHCNLVLGHAKDSAELLLKAAKYLAVNIMRDERV